MSREMDRRTMWLHAVELELQLWSIVIEVRLQDERLSTAIMLIATSNGDGPCESLEVFLIQCLSTLPKALENDQT